MQIRAGNYKISWRITLTSTESPSRILQRQDTCPASAFSADAHSRPPRHGIVGLSVLLTAGVVAKLVAGSCQGTGGIGRTSKAFVARACWLWHKWHGLCGTKDRLLFGHEVVPWLAPVVLCDLWDLGAVARCLRWKTSGADIGNFRGGARGGGAGGDEGVQCVHGVTAGKAVVRCVENRPLSIAESLPHCASKVPIDMNEKNSGRREWKFESNSEQIQHFWNMNWSLERWMISILIKRLRLAGTPFTQGSKLRQFAYCGHENVKPNPGSVQRRGCQAYPWPLAIHGSLVAGM